MDRSHDRALGLSETPRHQARCGGGHRGYGQPCAFAAIALVVTAQVTAAAPASPPEHTPAPPPRHTVTQAPLEATIVIAPPPQLAAMASRLAGHRIRLGDHVLLLEDVAAQGRPWVGRVAARCDQLWLDTAVGSLRLTGPLARMRIAGPSYLVWVIGTRTTPHELELSRLGILARPDELEVAPTPAPHPARDPGPKVPLSSCPLPGPS